MPASFNGAYTYSASDTDGELDFSIYTNGNTGAVLDGDLDQFIEASLKQGL